MDIDSLFSAWVAGVFCGFIASIGVGPVNLTVIEQGIRRGSRAAFMAGLGAIMAETIYAALALAGYARLLAGHPKIRLSLRAGAIAVVLALAFRYLLTRPQEERMRRPVERLDERWHHPKAWILGFLVTITNLTLLLLWATLVTTLYGHGWVHPIFQSRVACAGGVFLGGLIWYTMVATFVARAHHGLTIRQLTLLQRICGVIFLAFAAFLIYRSWRP